MPSAVDALDEEGLSLAVAGVPNAGARRIREYAPWVDRRHGGGGARRYLRFLLAEVRPRLLRGFALDRRVEAQGIGGASLGALFSLWALFEAKGEVGRVLAMSPTTWFAGERHRDFLLSVRPTPARIYLDCGLEEGRRGRARQRPGRRRRGKRAPTAYVRRVRRLRRALETIGYRRNAELVYHEEPGGTHDERSWARRLPAALAALFGAG